MKISQDVRDYAAARGIEENEALVEGMHEKSRQFLEEGADIYRKI